MFGITADDSNVHVPGYGIPVQPWGFEELDALLDRSTGTRGLVDALQFRAAIRGAESYSWETVGSLPRNRVLKNTTVHWHDSNWEDSEWVEVSEPKFVVGEESNSVTMRSAARWPGDEDFGIDEDGYVAERDFDPRTEVLLVIGK